MRNAMVVAASAAILFLCSCGGKTQSEAVPVAFAQAGEITACFTGPGATDSTMCSGGFGFRIDQNGSWTAGPSFAQKVTVTGQITANEANALQLAAQTMLNSVNGTKNCFGDGMLTGFGEDVVITLPGKPDAEVVFSNLQDPIQCLNADPNATNAFVGQIDQLRQKHYPIPFPGN